MSDKQPSEQSEGANANSVQRLVQAGSESPRLESSLHLVSLRSRAADREAYDYGWDAGMRGATVVNSHFSLFQNGRTKHWQQGYDDAKRQQANEKALP